MWKPVEVGTRASSPAPALRAHAVGWVEQLGKTPIVVQDVPGFASFYDWTQEARA
jgi:3-hydroxyacyl-CoA dehydrogenase